MAPRRGRIAGDHGLGGKARSPMKRETHVVDRGKPEGAPELAPATRLGTGSP